MPSTRIAIVRQALDDIVERLNEWATASACSSCAEKQTRTTAWSACGTRIRPPKRFEAAMLKGVIELNVEVIEVGKRGASPEGHGPPTSSSRSPRARGMSRPPICASPASSPRALRTRRASAGGPRRRAAPASRATREIRALSRGGPPARALLWDGSHPHDDRGPDLVRRPPRKGPRRETRRRRDGERGDRRQRKPKAGARRARQRRARAHLQGPLGRGRGDARPRLRGPLR